MPDAGHKARFIESADGEDTNRIYILIFPVEERQTGMVVFLYLLLNIVPVIHGIQIISAMENIESRKFLI